MGRAVGVETATGCLRLLIVFELPNVVCAICQESGSKRVIALRLLG